MWAKCTVENGVGGANATGVVGVSLSFFSAFSVSVLDSETVRNTALKLSVSSLLTGKDNKAELALPLFKCSMFLNQMYWDWSSDLQFR